MLVKCAHLSSGCLPAEVCTQSQSTWLSVCAVLRTALFDPSVCLLPSAAVGSAEASEPGTTGRAAALAAAAPAAAAPPAAAAAGAAAGASEVRGTGWAAAHRVLAGVTLGVMLE